MLPIGKILNLPANETYRPDTNLNRETQKSDRVQKWLDEECEEAPWNSVICYAKEQKNKREEAGSNKT
jgi:hypothetical protein